MAGWRDGWLEGWIMGCLLARRVMTQSSGLLVIVIGTVLMREEFTFIILFHVEAQITII